MPKDRKYGEAILEFGDIPEDEPIFIFRGRDMLLPDVLKSYSTLAVGVNAPQQHLDQILESYKQIKQWQDENPDRVRRPDSQSFIDRIKEEKA
jgi:hypothetical protein